MHLRILIMALIVAGLLFACGAGEEGVPEVAAQVNQPPEAVPVEPVPEAVSEGSFVFEANGQAKQYDYLPAGENFYTPVSSAIKARSAAGADEGLRIIFLSLDLKKVTYPVDLPAPRGGGTPKDSTIIRASIGFSFIDENGEEWAGPGKIHLESFGTDGVVVGTFTDVSLPHTEKELPNMVLTGGRVRAGISSPW